MTHTNIYAKRIQDLNVSWSAAVEAVWELLRKLKTQLLLMHDPASPLLGTCVQTEV